MDLIEKEKVIQEIDRLIKEHSGKYECDEAALVLDDLENFLDTIEAKEVDLEKEIKMFSMNLAIKENNGDWEKDIAVTAKHFFELGIKYSISISEAEEADSKEKVIQLSRKIFSPISYQPPIS